ncbi:UPF0149 family protein [Pelagibaculum spongiae]|uniref:YecA family protein n=1 Tax=Pelagibaculum spongiae TaxID=2080658 RepID=A0A2V1H2T6_9GAMM|nr:YecA family protein [Pelagibaculum spongiae]PVZ72290.1 hypothetical protein DC094_04580 [Pelagibaculum spongiae]
MQTLAEWPQLQQFEELLDKHGALAETPESQGLLCGLMCSAHTPGLKDWMEAMFGGEADLEEQEIDLLRIFYRMTTEGFVQSDFSFSPLIPDESAGLAARADALTSWVRGFMTGFALTGQNEKEPDDPTVGEALIDMRNLGVTQFDIDEEDDMDETEAAFEEIHEFVRVAAQLIFNDYAPEGLEPGDDERLH